MNGQWIWLKGDPFVENERACFTRAFELSGVPDRALLKVSADTRYVAYLKRRGDRARAGARRPGALVL